MTNLYVCNVTYNLVYEDFLRLCREVAAAVEEIIGLS